MRDRFSIGISSEILLGLAVVVGFVALVFWEWSLERPDKLYITSSGSIDMCLACHKDVTVDSSHDPRVIGCSPCHLGDPLAITEQGAHEGMVLNPGDLRHAALTCSVEGCHPQDINKVKKSLMATNRGILGTLLYYWGESESQDTDLTVEQLLESKENSLALDYFSKLCATCHLWKKKNDLPGLPQFFNEKGGGCSACHTRRSKETDLVKLFRGEREEISEDEKKLHPAVTARVTSAHCIRCHNRSGRIGISYMGIFESEGYGTPYEKGQLSSMRLPGDRFYLELADDIHHKQGMECIDCHTRDEIMGDGTSYAHYEEQLEISCETCHLPEPGTTRKKNALTNIETGENGYQIMGKVDDKVHNLKMIKQGVCDFSAHERVSCEACHSTWVAQCYGCHARRDADKLHLDKLKLQETSGRWTEGRSYIRYEKPMLGVWKDEIVVVTPGCQDLVTVIDEDGAVEKSFNRFTMAAINPHTTQAQGRSCLDCHASTKTVGLGEGRIVSREGELVFVSQSRGLVTAAGETVPFDAYVDLSGKALQKSSRAELRPFNGQELRGILRVGLCVGCHDSYGDPLWQNYSKESVCRRVNEANLIMERTQSQ